MCNRIETRRPGILRSLLACLAGRPAPGSGDPRPFPTCELCGAMLGPGDAEALHEGWCYTCDANWFEEQVCRPLVKRLGRRGAVMAFRNLVGQVNSPM